MTTPRDLAETDMPRQIDGDRLSATDSSLANWNYEETVRQIEAIMAQIESGELELADVFDQFAVAVKHLRQCEEFLGQRQQQMDLLIETLPTHRSEKQESGTDD
ncbi:MAG: exodeoxyribonuclease VII small subunit [Stenomitos frigidus ULC029]